MLSVFLTLFIPFFFGFGLMWFLIEIMYGKGEGSE